MTKKKLLIITVIVVGLLGISGISQTGRTSVSKLFALLKGQQTAAPAVPKGDVEQRARIKHGWDKQPVNNSLVHGTIVYYDNNGMAVKQANLTLYRKYPERIRIELESNGNTEIVGFDQSQAWKSGRASLTEEEARDIRAFIRMWPERLFTNRGGGARYKEAGTRIEDDKSARNVPTPPQADSKAPDKTTLIFDQVEIEDSLGPASTASRAGDRRLIYYSVNREDAVVTAARWLEPDDPRQRLEDPSLSATDMRVNFSAWKEIEGILWPAEITCIKGGKKSFRIELSDVKINQQMNEGIFQRP
jgi:hypothetical protein